MRTLDAVATTVASRQSRRRSDEFSILPSADVVSAARAGDERAIEELYRRTVRRSRAAARCYCGAIDAEDAASEGFLRALVRLDQLRDPNAVEAWIVRCVARAAIDLARRQRRQQPNSTAVERLGASGPQSESAAERALSELERDLLAEVISQLPDPARLLLRLRYHAGWSVAQISGLLDIPPGTVRRQCVEACQLAGQRFLLGQLQPARGDCTPSTDQLCRAAWRQMSALARRRVAEHLRRCPACRSRARELAELTGPRSPAIAV